MSRQPPEHDFGPLSEREREIVNHFLDHQNLWKDVLLDQCVVHHMGWDEQDPRSTLNKLMCLSNQIALDPLVSREAKQLIAQGRADAKGDIKAALESLIHRRLDR